MMQDIFRNVLAFLFMCVLASTLFCLCGGSLDGVLYGQWPENYDHPTNWLDQSQHQ
jgi:hypothetical protein